MRNVDEVGNSLLHLIPILPLSDESSQDVESIQSYSVISIQSSSLSECEESRPGNRQKKGTQESKRSNETIENDKAISPSAILAHPCNASQDG